MHEARARFRHIGHFYEMCGAGTRKVISLVYVGREGHKVLKRTISLTQIIAWCQIDLFEGKLDAVDQGGTQYDLIFKMS
jgi:hypothetical protein